MKQAVFALVILVFSFSAFGKVISFAEYDRFCSPTSTSIERLRRARMIFLQENISFENRGDDSLLINPDPNGPKLNQQAARLQKSFGAKMIYDPSRDCAVFARALTRDGKRELQLGFWSVPDLSEATFVHETNHLKLANAQTNGGFDSWFFGSIDDKKWEGSYNSFSLDEIAAFATEFHFLAQRQKIEELSDLANAWRNIDSLSARGVKYITTFKTQLSNFLKRQGAAFYRFDNRFFLRDDYFSILIQADSFHDDPSVSVFLSNAHTTLSMPLYALSVDKFNKLVSSFPKETAIPVAESKAKAVKEMLQYLVSRFEAMTDGFQKIHDSYARLAGLKNSDGGQPHLNLNEALKDDEKRSFALIRKIEKIKRVKGL